MRSSILILLFLFCVTSVLGQESAKDTTVVEIEGRQFYKYVVQPGNTLYSISRSYKVTVQDIEEHNPGATNGLSIGDTLFILAAGKDRKLKKKQMEIDGNIIVHEVQKGQTLYGIAKIYSISVNDIISINPDLKSGVKQGQLIKIPIVKLKEEAKIEETKDSVRSEAVHIVKAKETLYSLSKMYGVSIEEIKSANNGLPEGLKIGMELIIPGDDLEDQNAAFPADTTVRKEEYKIGIIFPVYLDLNDTLMANLKIDDKEKVMPKSTVAIQFYQGAELALDSMTKSGYNFSIEYFDSAKDSVAIQQIIQRGDLDSLDLIIGPFYLTQFKQVSSFAKKKKIHIVSPVPQNNRILLGNPYVSKVATSRNILFKQLGEYFAKNYRTENLIIVGQRFRENPLSLAFKRSYLETLAEVDSVSAESLKEVKWSKEESIEVISQQLDSTKFNILIVPSKDQIYVTNFLAALNDLHEDYMFKVIGMDHWMKYTNVDYEYFENLRVHLPVDGYTNYDDPKVLGFIKKYKEKFEIFPEKYALQGFDITFYYMSLLQNGGTRFESLLTNPSEDHLYFDFEFFKTGMESGYENSSARLLKYDYYTIKQISKLP